MSVPWTARRSNQSILKGSKGKATYKGNPICLTADLSAETLQASSEWQDIFKVLKEKNKGYKKIFEEIIVENFCNNEKEIVNQVQEAQRVQYRINPRRNTPIHILIKLTKTKHKERN